MFEDDQGRQQFVTEVVAAKADIGEGRQRANDTVRSDIIAKIGLQAPDAQDHGLVDAVGLLGFGEPGFRRVGLGAAALDTVGETALAT